MSSIFISGVYTSKVIIDWSNSFQFEFVLFLECVTEGFWVFHTAEIYPRIATEPVGGTGLKATGLEASRS